MAGTPLPPPWQGGEKKTPAPFGAGVGDGCCVGYLWYGIAGMPPRSGDGPRLLMFGGGTAGATGGG
jgi:hypothetical protein